MNLKLWFDSFEKNKHFLLSETWPVFMSLREQALAALSSIKWPDRKTPHWNYLSDDALQAQQTWEEKPEDNHELFIDDFYLILFLDGVFQPEQSNLPHSTYCDFGLLSELYLKENKHLEKSITVDLIDDKDVPLLMNAAFLQDGAILKIKAKQILDKPILLLNAYSSKSKDAAKALRHTIHIEASAHATVIEYHAAIQPVAFHENTVIQLQIDKQAQVAYFQLTGHSHYSSHNAHLQIEQHENSICNVVVLPQDVAFFRQSIHNHLRKPGAYCEIHGGFDAYHQQQFAQHTTISHHAPHTRSYQKYRGIAQEKSRIVVQGNILIAPQAIHTHARLESQHMLLSAAAQIHNLPCLEIYADDVHCSHGATIGNLDKNALMYLQARGFDKQNATRTLCRAFLQSIFEKIPAHISQLLSKNSLGETA